MVIRPKYSVNAHVKYLKNDKEYDAIIRKVIMINSMDDYKGDIFSSPITFDYLIEYYIPIDDMQDSIENARVSENELTI